MIAALLAQAAEEPPCGKPEDTRLVCEAVLNITNNQAVAEAAEAFIARPARIVLIALAAWVISRLARRLVRRFTRGLGTVSADVASAAADRTAGTLLRTSRATTPRAVQRAETIGALLGSVVGVVVWTIALLMILGEFEVDLAPLLAGAGIVGIAIGFGAQNLVRDFLSGIFMLIEDQYGVGDVIDAGPATGTVEGISLRTTRIRDIEGNVWHIPNGVIERVANKSQEWSRALLDIQVAYGTDTDHASAVIKRVADEMWNDPDWAEDILAEPEVWGVEKLGADGLSIRLVVKTKPLSQWKVSRHLRARIKDALQAEGIEIPFPQRVIWHRNGDEDHEDGHREADQAAHSRS